MKLIDAWKQVLLRAYSMWLAYFGAIFGALSQMQAEVVALLPALKEFAHPSAYAWASLACLVGIPIARIIHQTRLKAEQLMAEDQKFLESIDSPSE
jgi:TRAP-type C4-dicarboxylate transport system permease small subunit